MIHALNSTDTLLFATAVATSATQTANLDTKGADWATIRLAFLAEANTNAIGPTINLLESDDTVVTNFATVTAAIAGSDGYLASAAEVRYEVDLRKRKRYLRLQIAPGTATNDGITVAAIATLSRKEKTPEAHSELAGVAVVVT